MKGQKAQDQSNYEKNEVPKSKWHGRKGTSSHHPIIVSQHYLELSCWIVPSASWDKMGLKTIGESHLHKNYNYRHPVSDK